MRIDPLRRFEWNLILLCVAGLIGCVPADRRRDEPSPTDLDRVRRSHERIYQRTCQRFERAAFFSPDPETTPGDLRWMSPLIVEQLDPQQAEDSPRTGFGRLIADESGHLIVDPDEPTVYHASSTVEFDGESHGQSTFLWFYASTEPNGRPAWRGFRMLLDDRGFTMIWEILSSDSPLRVFYVAKPVEEAARRQYGSPLPGRRYSVEPSLRDHPDIIVARIVADGPQPMGPFLYLDHPDRQVTTLICRCEPSQVDLFPTSRHYRLITLFGEDGESNHAFEYFTECLHVNAAQSAWPSDLR